MKQTLRPQSTGAPPSVCAPEFKPAGPTLCARPITAPRWYACTGDAGYGCKAAGGLDHAGGQCRHPARNPKSWWIQSVYRRQRGWPGGGKGIGGSDAAAILGISPWRTARDLYDDKLGIASAQDDSGNWVALGDGTSAGRFGCPHLFPKDRVLNIPDQKDVPQPQAPLYVG